MVKVSYSLSRSCIDVKKKKYYFSISLTFFRHGIAAKITSATEFSRNKYTPKSANAAVRTIHSFILNIYIAPLQENYSEALPTPARSNKAVLRCEKNAGEVVLLKM